MRHVLLLICCLILNVSASAEPPSRGVMASKSKDESSPDRSRKEPTLPFLGRVPAVKSTELIELPSQTRRIKLPFTVFRTADRRFVFAEYLRKGTPRSEKPDKRMEVTLEVVGQKLTGIPEQPPSIAWEKALESVVGGMPLGTVHQVTVAYVMYQFDNLGRGSAERVRPAEPVFESTMRSLTSPLSAPPAVSRSYHLLAKNLESMNCPGPSEGC